MTSALPPPGADRRQVLVPVASRDHPWGVVVARDPHAGQLVRCLCGAERWTTYGHAARHGRTCPTALMASAHRAALRGFHGRAKDLRHQAVLAALRGAGRRGWPAPAIASVLGYSSSHTRRVLRAYERAGIAERRRRRPYLWRRRKARPEGAS